jgi:hypothetical protein
MRTPGCECDGPLPPPLSSLCASPPIVKRPSKGETVQNLGVITPLFETDDVPHARR